jgi:hypothetical protein
LEKINGMSIALKNPDSWIEPEQLQAPRYILYRSIQEVKVQAEKFELQVCGN